jgi:hypothetical protein
LNTHDVLAFAIAGEAVTRIRGADPDWTSAFSQSVHSTSARSWPLPDFVIVDEIQEKTTAAEFKPPDQTKREYLTGLGQAVAYTRDFDHSILVTPSISDDGYPIGEHIQQVLDQDIAVDLPIGLLQYEPADISPSFPKFTVLRQVRPRAQAPTHPASIENSFWAKWREASPQELGLFLEYLYEEGRKVDPVQSIRDRAFDRLWVEMTQGRTRHWGGKPRKLTDGKQKVGWGKNFRNFLAHLGWTAGDGALTGDGLDALHIVHLYGGESQVFSDHLARAVLLAGKHLVLLNEINEFQDTAGGFDSENDWLDGLELRLEDDGLLKRNPARHEAAERGSARQFLKAEKQLWRNLGLIVPRGKRVYHPGRGFIFDWGRITSLLS